MDECRDRGILRILVTALLCAAVFALSFNVTVLADASGDASFYQAASVLVMDAHSGQVLFESDGYTRRYPASVTKVMTALLVLENVQDLSERVTISPNAVDLPYYASRMGMLEGETMTVLEALYGIMLPSANEVARALGEHVSGSVPEFVNMMNRRAMEIGAHNTRFINPCGLPGGGQYTTAYDIARIMQAAVRFPIFNEIIATAYFELPPTELHEDVRLLRNTNRMVRPTHQGYNEWIVGGKTGFTNDAQHTLVSYARRGGHSLIISVLYAPQVGVIFSDTEALMDRAFGMLIYGGDPWGTMYASSETEEDKYRETDVPDGGGESASDSDGTVTPGETSDTGSDSDEPEEPFDKAPEYIPDIPGWNVQPGDPSVSVTDDSSADDDQETVLVFAPSPDDGSGYDSSGYNGAADSGSQDEAADYPSDNQSEASTSFDTEAVLVASASLGITLAALLFVWWARKKVSRVGV